MIWVYKRVSTGGQTFEQQDNFIRGYLATVGNPEHRVIEEKISGTVKYGNRKLSEVLEKAKKGDTIVVSELSRLGRTINDLFLFVCQCEEKGLHLVQAKDNQVLTDGIVGKVMVFALSLCAQIERDQISERTKSGLSERFRRWDSLKDGDIYISNSGREYVKGSGESPKIKRRILTEEEKALIRFRNEERNKTPEREECFSIAKEMLRNGETLRGIASTLNSLGRKTPTGCEWKATSVKRLLDRGY